VRGRVVDVFERNGRDYWTIEYAACDPEGDVYVRHRMSSTVDRDDQQQPSAPADSAGQKAAPPDLSPSPERRWHSIELTNQIEFGAQYGRRFGVEFDPRENAHTDV